MCTAAAQKNLPDWMTNLSGTSVSVNPGSSKNGADVPLGAEDAQTKSLLQRREAIKQAQENPGSHIPKGIRTRKDIMNELT